MLSLDDDVAGLLRELAADLRATHVALVDDPSARSGVPAKTLPVGAGQFLRVELGARGPAGVDVAVRMEEAVRALRTAARRWGVLALPSLEVRGSQAASELTARARIDEFVGALREVGGVTHAVLQVRGQRLAHAPALDEPSAARIEFVAAQLAHTQAPGSSHAELVQADAYALRFWYDACLVLLCTAPYAVDFVRHRVRGVARELTVLLPMLEPDPSTPAGRRPRRQTAT